MPAHIKSMLNGVSLQVPVAEGRMALGTWQGVYVAEHRSAPHRREVILQFLGLTAPGVTQRSLQTTAENWRRLSFIEGEEKHDGLSKTAAGGGLNSRIPAGTAVAQGASPPPAVSVSPVVSPHNAMLMVISSAASSLSDKVDIVARFTGFIEQRNFTEGQQVKKAICCSASSKTPTKPRSISSAPISPGPKPRRSTPICSCSAPRSWSTTRTCRNPRSTSASPIEQSAQADVMQAQALLEQAQINLGYTEIRSPIDGRIGIANFTVGNLVGPSSGTLGDDRQPGSDLRHLSGERGRYHRLSSAGSPSRPTRTRM